MEEKCFAEIIKTQRNKKGLTQSELAEKMFITREKISSWEHGRDEPSYSEIVRLSDIFGVAPTVFFSGYDVKEETVSLGTIKELQRIKRKVTSIESFSKLIEKKVYGFEELLKIAFCMFLWMLVGGLSLLNRIWLLFFIPSSILIISFTAQQNISEPIKSILIGLIVLAVIVSFVF